MKTGKAGLDLIKKFEGFSAIPYCDSVGLPTIGYGHLIKAGEKFAQITESEAEKLLASDITLAEYAVDLHVEENLTQNEFDALVSFVFNVGTGRTGGKDGFVYLKSGKSSTLLNKLNMANFAAAADEILKWDRADGKRLPGLTRRREAEREMFLGES